MNRRSLQYFYIYFLVILAVGIFCFFLQRFNGVGYLSELYSQHGYYDYTSFPWEKFALFSTDDLNLGFLEKLLALAIILFPLHMSILNKTTMSLNISLVWVIFLWLILGEESEMNLFGYSGSGGGMYSYTPAEFYFFTLIPVLILSWFIGNKYLQWYKSKQLS